MADNESLAGKSVDALGNAAKKALSPIQQMHKSFEQLSQTGNRFGNDMVQLGISAANARMPIEEFTKLMGENAEKFAALGGNVNKGGQVFSEFAKTFHTSGMAENLRQIGFTAGELNEILALQVGFQKSTFDNSTAGQAKAAAAAAEFAFELDALTQLTGQSRKEQEDNLKKVQADMKVEAKFRLIGLEKGETAEAEARAAFKQQYAQMSAKGMGDLYKEVFATGTTMTRGAQAQMAMTGKAGLAVAQSATELSRGNIEYAKALKERADIEVMALQSNKAYLRNVIFTGGDLGDAARKNMKDNDVAYHGMRTTMKEEKIARDDISAALVKQRQVIKEEQDARKGITTAMITGKQQIETAFAAFMERIVGGVNRDQKLNDQLLKTSEKFSMTKPGEKPSERADSYIKAKAVEKDDPSKPATQQKAYEEAMGKFGGDWAVKLGTSLGAGLIKGADSAVTGTFEMAKKLFPVENMTVTNFTGAQRHTGTLGETGGLTEPKDIIAKLKKGETVMTPEQLKNAMKGAENKGIENMLSSLQSKDSTKSGSLDISKIAAEIRTSISKVEITNWPKDMGKVEVKPQEGTATKPAETTQATGQAAKPAEKKEESKTAESKAEKASKVAEEVLIKSGDTLSVLAKKYGTSVAELMKANPAIKDANKILAGAKLTIPGQEKKEVPTNDLAAQKQEAKFRLVGIEKGEEAEKKARKDYAIENKKSDTKVTIDGKDVDPNSPEGQAVIKKLENEEKKLRELFNGKFGTQKAMDMAKDLQSSMPVPKIEDFTGIKLKNADIIKEIMEESLPVQGLKEKSEEIGKNAWALNRAYKESMESSVQENEEHLKYLNEKEQKRIEQQKQNDAEIEQLQTRAQEQRLSLEDEEQLIALKIRREILKSNEEFNKAEIEGTKKALDEQLGMTGDYGDEMLSLVEKSNESQLESLGGMTDAAIAARDDFMQQLNTTYGEGELDSSFEEDEYGEGGEAIGGEMDSAFVEDEYQALEDLTNQIQGLKEFEEDEYGEGGEAIGGKMDSAFAEDEYGALEDLENQIIGLKEFEEDEYGEGGEAIGGKMDSAFAEDEDDYVSQALKEFSAQIPETLDSTADDAAYAGGPGDASVAGIDFATNMSGQSNNFVDYANGPPSSESNFAPISYGDFTIGPDGMPIPKPKSEAKSIPGAVKKDDKDKEAAKKAKEQEKKDKAKSDTKKDDKDSTKPGEAKPSTKNLDDVVKTLESLNSSVNRLITKVEETGKQSVSAMKSLDGNLYKR